MAKLARVLDRGTLEAIDGPHGKMTLTLSAADLGEPVEIVIPSRLVCARCDGGGCDACSRSGALRVALDEAARTTHVALPKEAADSLRVRLVRPLGEEAGLELLTIEIHLTAAPPPPSVPKQALELRSFVIAAALALAAALAIAATMR